MFNFHIGKKHHHHGNGHAHENGNGNHHHGLVGKEVLRDPHQNQFTAFPKSERDTLGIRGLIPPVEESQEKQMKREVHMLRKREKPIEKYMHLMSLLSRNERLFYQLVVNHIEETMPLVYTPVVGEACIRFSELIQYPLGIFISLEDAGHIEEIFNNWKLTHPEVKAIVVTDGVTVSRVLIGQKN